jgi:phosphoadenosine phosphosulfate reductase
MTDAAPIQASQLDDSGPARSVEAGCRAGSRPEGETGAISVCLPDLEQSTAPDVLAYAVESYPRLRVACSFQKEESVLFHMLAELRHGREGVRAFAIDTGVLFGETLATWKRFEERFALPIDVFDASSSGRPWTVENCCSAAKVAALEQALTDVDAWITGIRRDQAPTRAQSLKVELDVRRGIVKFNPLADWSEKDIWRYIFEHDLPYNPLHDEGYASIGCAPCTQPGSGREGRWAGTDKTECGIHVEQVQ